MTTLFVSDLHLDPSRPEATRAFLAFLRNEAAACEALYVLGDLFEAWVGDDDDAAPGTEVADALRRLSTGGVPVYFMRGNRDFLLGEDYAHRCGMRVLPDPAVVSLHGKPVLLMHGDLLCTDDTGYQAFRRQVRDPAWQQQFLAQPLAARRAYATQARQASQKHHDSLAAAGQAELITDVNADTVARHFQQFGVDTLIHGHTHRPAVHGVSAAGRDCMRIVLGDWYEHGSVLEVDARGHRLRTLALA